LSFSFSSCYHFDIVFQQRFLTLFFISICSLLNIVTVQPFGFPVIDNDWIIGNNIIWKKESNHIMEEKDSDRGG